MFITLTLHITCMRLMYNLCVVSQIHGTKPKKRMTLTLQPDDSAGVRFVLSSNEETSGLITSQHRKLLASRVAKLANGVFGLDNGGEWDGATATNPSDFHTCTNNSFNRDKPCQSRSTDDPDPDPDRISDLPKGVGNSSRDGVSKLPAALRLVDRSPVGGDASKRTLNNPQPANTHHHLATSRTLPAFVSSSCSSTSPSESDVFESACNEQSIHSLPEIWPALSPASENLGRKRERREVLTNGSLRRPAIHSAAINDAIRQTHTQPSDQSSAAHSPHHTEAAITDLGKR